MLAVAVWCAVDLLRLVPPVDLASACGLRKFAEAEKIANDIKATFRFG